jgi:hypothetical protein
MHTWVSCNLGIDAHFYLNLVNAHSDPRHLRRVGFSCSVHFLGPIAENDKVPSKCVIIMSRTTDLAAAAVFRLVVARKD